jgi:hypothetical protein
VIPLRIPRLSQIRFLTLAHKQDDLDSAFSMKDLLNSLKTWQFQAKSLTAKVKISNSPACSKYKYWKARLAPELKISGSEYIYFRVPNRVLHHSSQKDTIPALQI